MAEQRPYEKHAIDLTRHHFMRELGDICLFGTWVFNDDQEDTEPALVLVPRYRHPSTIIPCVIALSAAHKYDDPVYLAWAAKGIAHSLGFEDSMTTTHRIADIIHSHLPDLVSMPVDPTSAVVMAEAELTSGDGKKRSVQLLDYEQIR